MIGRLFLLALLGWLAGFALFVVAIPHAPMPGRADGVVVLTGGPGRLQRGFDLLRASAVRRMLVSGADPSVRPHELAREYHVPTALFARIDLGHEAVDTRSNADEAAAWARDHGYHTLRLVTTDWHMARAKLELAHVLPADIRILPDPVASEPDLTSLVREYNKYLLRRVVLATGR